VAIFCLKKRVFVSRSSRYGQKNTQKMAKNGSFRPRQRATQQVTTPRYYLGRPGTPRRPICRVCLEDHPFLGLFDPMPPWSVFAHIISFVMPYNPVVGCVQSLTSVNQFYYRHICHGIFDIWRTQFWSFMFVVLQKPKFKNPNFFSYPWGWSSTKTPV
jgi:hypothetical protein